MGAVGLTSLEKLRDAYLAKLSAPRRTRRLPPTPEKGVVTAAFARPDYTRSS